MCELLGMFFNKSVRPSISFRGFRHRGDHNPDGWGMARAAGRVWQVFKEPRPATASTLAEFLMHYREFRSHIFIGHVRFATGGKNARKNALRNTHPFIRVFRKREICLAHNGSLRTLDRRGLIFLPCGQTDSELLLCRLLSEMSMRRRNIRFNDYEEICKLLNEFNVHGKMNVIFSDGRRLFIYRDNRGHKSLYYTWRKWPFPEITLEDEDWSIALNTEKDVDIQGIIVATKPLTTGEKWHPIPKGKLLVAERIQETSHENRTDYQVRTTIISK